MKRWAVVTIGVAIGVALLAMMSPTWPPDSATTDALACDANAKPANLNFTLKDMDGKDVVLSAYKGQVILLDFWATWCGPCKVEIPGFVDLYTRYRSKGFVVLGFSVDDTVAKLKPYVAQYKMNYPVIVGNGRDDVQEAYGPILGLPTSVLIGRDGKICRKHTGFTEKEQFEREIQGLL